MILKYLTAATAMLAGFAQAATLTVNSVADDGSAGTLRWAMEQSNLNTNEADEILFDASLAGQTIVFAGSQIADNFPQLLSTEVTIDGSAAPGITIDRNGGGRIFILSTSNTVTIRNLTLTNSDGLFGGSCVRISGATPDIVLDRVTFEHCVSRESSDISLGGAIYADMDAGGILAVRRSTFNANISRGGTGEVYGGAIYASGGTVSITDSRFNDNAVIDDNNAFEQGGAVFVRNADVTLNRNVFTRNVSAQGAGGALAINLGTSHAARLTGNVFVDNTAELGAAFWAGTQVIGGAPAFDLTNNQFIGNTTGPSSTAGAVFFREGTIRMRNNTFDANSSSGGGAAHLAYRSGTDPVVFATVWNNAFGRAFGPACDTTSGSPVSFPSAGYNLFPDDSCQISGPGTVIDADARFLELGPNGGPVFTVRPVAGNPAIEGGNPAAPSGADWTRCAVEDARLIARPFDADGDSDAVCDMGAFEWQTTPLPLPPLLQDRFEAMP
jgi:hypothetical protein